MGVDARAFAYPCLAGPMSLSGKPRLSLLAVRSSWPPLAVASQQSVKALLAKVRTNAASLQTEEDPGGGGSPNGAWCCYNASVFHRVTRRSRGLLRLEDRGWGYLRTAASLCYALFLPFAKWLR